VTPVTPGVRINHAVSISHQIFITILRKTIIDYTSRQLFQISLLIPPIRKPPNKSRGFHAGFHRIGSKSSDDGSKKFVFANLNIGVAVKVAKKMLAYLLAIIQCL
jgi:hypothetical protein